MPDLYEIPDLEWYTTNFDGHTAWRGHSGTFSVLLVFQGGYWRIDAHSIGGGCMYGYWKGVDAAKAASNANWKSRMASALRPVKLTMRIDNMNQPVTPFIINGAPDAAGGVG
jgi:hypothetical protein